jgi:hypothetical protein
MQLLGINIGKKPAENAAQSDPKAVKKTGDIKQQLNHVLKFTARYETTIVALAVALLLAVTSLRMLHYMNPQTDDAKVQEVLAKNNKIKIDQKTVERLKELQANGASTPTPTKTQAGRTNPFTE